MSKFPENYRCIKWYVHWKQKYNIIISNSVLYYLRMQLLVNITQHPELNDILVACDMLQILSVIDSI